MKTVLRWAGISLALFVMAKAAWTTMVNTALTSSMAPVDYTQTVETGGPLEAAYMAMGSQPVERWEVPAPEEDWGTFVAYYPAALPQTGEQYPVVVMLNGTGVGASKYPAVFEHLASWGFIVVGSDDPSTCTGESADATLAWLLNENADPDSRFYQKVDQANIGICGHSQGGVGVFNAVNANPRGGLYRCAVSLSPVDIEVAAALHLDYDPHPHPHPAAGLQRRRRDPAGRPAAAVRGAGRPQGDGPPHQRGPRPDAVHRRRLCDRLVPVAPAGGRGGRRGLYRRRARAAGQRALPGPADRPVTDNKNRPAVPM